MLLEAELSCHCGPSVQLSVSMMTSLSHAQQGKYFSNPVSERLGRIFLIFVVQNVYLCAFTNCFPGPRNLCNFNEGDRLIHPSMFLHCLFKDPKVEKLRNIINTFIISLCKNSYAIAMFFWLWL